MHHVNLDGALAQYQLWTVELDLDPDSPVDGGVFDIAGDGSGTVIPITAKLALNQSSRVRYHPRSTEWRGETQAATSRRHRQDLIKFQFGEILGCHLGFSIRKSRIKPNASTKCARSIELNAQAK